VGTQEGKGRDRRGDEGKGKRGKGRGRDGWEEPFPR